MSIWTKTSSGWVEIGGGGGSDGLEGLGGWAEITEVTGSPKRYAYNDGGMDWVAFEWTADGSLRTQAGGLVDALVVNPGTLSQGGSGGDAGRLIYGLQTLPAISPVNIFVATDTDQGSVDGSAIGSITPGIAINHHTQPKVFTAGSRTGPAFQSNTKGAGYKSSIMGVEREYSKCYSVPNYGDLTDLVSYAYGDGGQHNPGNPGGQTAMQGVVIVRVPAAQAAGVDPGSWVTRIDYYAEVTDGIVTDLYQERFYGDDTVRTENGRYASPEQPDDLIPCDPSVAEGWTYADGEFTPPPPDPSWREEAIEALKQQLKDLQKDT